MSNSSSKASSKSSSDENYSISSEKQPEEPPPEEQFQSKDSKLPITPIPKELLENAEYSTFTQNKKSSQKQLDKTV